LAGGWAALAANLNEAILGKSTSFSIRLIDSSSHPLPSALPWKNEALRIRQAEKMRMIMVSRDIDETLLLGDQVIVLSSHVLSAAKTGSGLSSLKISW
jgi:hypothetical protein